MHRGNVIELIDYALSRLRAGKTPGKIKEEIQSAGAGWSAVEVNRALAAAIIQLQVEKAQASQQAEIQHRIEPTPAAPLIAVEVPRGNEAVPATSPTGKVEEVDIEQKLAEITAQNELENQTSQAIGQGKENKYSVAFPGDELLFHAANNWGVLAALVLALVMLIVVVILVLKVA